MFSHAHVGQLVIQPGPIPVKLHEVLTELALVLLQNINLQLRSFIS